MNLPVALQLYTLREYTSTDFIGTLEKVAKLGYKGVEFAGFGGLSAAEIKAELKRLDLTVVGNHVSIAALESDLDAIIAYTLEIGCNIIIMPWFYSENAEGYIELGKNLDAIGAKCKENGITLCYHNHAREFAILDGKSGIDHIFDNASPENLHAEIDTYWTEFAGIDTIAYLSTFKGRLPLLHIKDMDKETRETAEIGEGLLDIASFAKAAQELGTTWLVVEQDRCPRHPAIESVEISMNNLKKMGLA